MGIAEILRDAPAGQLARLYLGWKIARYADEKEGYDHSQPPAPEEPLQNAVEEDLPGTNGERDIEQDDASDKEDNDDKEKIDKDLERDGAYEPAEPVPVPQGEKSQPAPKHDPSEVKWAGPTDRDNPQNWSTGKKVFVFAQICLLTFSIYSASSIITPAEGYFMEHFGISEEVSALVLSMYVFGYGLGPLIFSPMSEMPMVGRNVAYLSSFFIFIVMTAVGSRVSKFPGFVVIRFIQGFFGGPVLATGAASAQDIFPFNKVPYALSFWAFFAYGGPALGPVLAGFSVPLSTWRWSMYETLILSGFIFILLFFFLPETNAEYILAQRAARLRSKTGDSNLLSKTESRASSLGHKNWVQLTVYHLTMPFKITLLDPSILFINLYTALVYGIYYSFFESFPIVYLETYHYSIGIMGTIFISVIVGAGLGVIIYGALVWYIYEPYTLQYGIGKPEYRLVPGIFAAAFAPAGMFIFGYAARSDINWIAPTVGLALYAGASFVLMNCIFIYLPISYPRYAASVFASNGFFRSAMATGAIHFSQPLFHNLGVGDGCAILGSLAAACTFGFLGLWYYGPKLRARSKFAETY